MWKNYLKVAWRNLWNNKSFSFINIFGLALGMTTCVLISLYVLDERSYDRHHKDGYRIYRVAMEVMGEKHVANAAPVADGLKRDFPGVEQVTRLLRFPGAEKVLLRYEEGQKQFFEVNAYYVDSTFFEVFTYNFKFGNIDKALDQPNSIVLSEQIADKFFGDKNPVDEVLKVSLPFGEFDYTVKGVFKDNGHKSHIPANLFFGMDNQDVGTWVERQTNWATNNIFHTYVKLREGTDANLFESKLDGFLDRNGGADLKAAGFTKQFFIQPLEDIYLHSNYGYEIAPTGNIRHLYIFASIAAFILLIACINYMNLSTARSEKRAKEVGMRKVVGATRSALAGQFLAESLLTSGLALLLTIVLIQGGIPVFNQLTGKELTLVQVPNIFAWLAAITLSTGLLSGLYPAFYLSSFKPISVLKGKIVHRVSALSIRKGLVVFQFAISTALILSALLINEQMKFLDNQHLGFDKNQKIVLPLQTSEANSNSSTLKNELLNNPHVITAAKGSTYPGVETVGDMLFYAEGKSIQEAVDIKLANVGEDYMETLGIVLLEGREFVQELTADENALILNENAVAELGYTVHEAVGKNVHYEWENTMYTMSIIGVVKDYHFQSLHQEIKPLALTVSPFFASPGNYLIANVKSGDYPALIAGLQKSWESINPNSPFACSFLDQDFERNYEKEERTSRLIQSFTFIAIVIACLGLFGLAAFTAEQRTKEIGIRKVLGASVMGITQLLSRDFLKLVILGIVLSIPLSWYLMDRWLENFAYRMPITVSIFVLGAGVAVAIALTTVSFQSIKAAMMNPVDSLRSE